MVNENIFVNSSILKVQDLLFRIRNFLHKVKMNESYERALNQVSVLKKTLNSEKTSHQNTLQQLQTTYQIIDDIKQMLKSEQDKNKELTRQLRAKNHKIEEISREYEDQIMNIKELIERKDFEIKKYTQVKVTDYDMIRFRVISEVEAQHTEEIQLLKKQIQKQEFLYNESLFENKVLRDKNNQLEKNIEQLKQQSKLFQQDIEKRHNAEVNKAYIMLEQEKLSRRQTEKRLEREKEKYQQTIQKYHQELEVLQLQLINRTSNKQNAQRHSNLNGNNSSLLQLKQSEFALENQKLKRQLKNKTQELQEVSRKHKSQLRELNKKNDQLQKQVNEARFQTKQLQAQINETRTSSQQQVISKCKREFEKKERSLKEKQDYEIQSKEKEIRKLTKEIQNMRRAENNEAGRDTIHKEDALRLQRENSQLQTELKKTKAQMNQRNDEKKKQEEFQNRQTRAVSVQNVKQKLDAANQQIVSLLKNKIALNEKIAKLSRDK